jgi:hypothetical protein
MPAQGLSHLVDAEMDGDRIVQLAQEVIERQGPPSASLREQRTLKELQPTHLPHDAHGLIRLRRTAV